MNQVRLYLDEDTMRDALVVALRNSDVDVTTVLEANRLGLSDEEQLIWASEQRLALYSFNVRDYCRLHSVFMASEISHTGIILVPRQRYSVGQQLRGLLKLIATKSAEEITNQLVYLGTYLN